MELSSRNGWIDEEGKVYIYFTRQSVMEIMDCGSKKAGQLLAELDGKTGIGLITRVRQGLGKPDRIYVRKCITPRMPVRGSPQAESALPDVSNDHIRRCQKDTSAGVENAGLEESKGSPNHTEKNNMRTMKFEPVTAHIPMKMYSIIHSPECFYRFVEDFEIDGVCWDTVAGTMSPYFLRLLETGNSARPRSSDHSFNYKTEKLPRSLSEYLYCLFDHSCMWRQKSGNLICTAQPYGTRKMVMDSFSRMMEECDYPETIKMEMLDNRYRFRTNGDFLLLFYSSSSPRLILPESIAPPVHTPVFDGAWIAMYGQNNNRDFR